MQPTRITIPKVEPPVLFLQIATLLKSTLKDDFEQVVSVFEALSDRYSVGDELVVSSEVW